MKYMMALVIIDMQNGCFNPSRPAFDTEGVIQRNNKLSDRFINSQFPVIFIQHRGTKQNSYIPYTEEWQIIPSLTKIQRIL
jgi:nicotinamidase-related amidase